MNFTYVFYSFICLVSASLLASLLFSYTFSGEAGITRLPEKFPRAAQRLERWASRWDQLRAVLQVLTVVFQLASVSLMVISLYASSLPLAKLLVPAVLYSTLYLFLMKILPLVLSESYADRITITAPVAASCGCPA